VNRASVQVPEVAFGRGAALTQQRLCRGACLVAKSDDDIQLI